MSFDSIRVPKFFACCRISSISSGPLMPWVGCGLLAATQYGWCSVGQGRLEVLAGVAGGPAGEVLDLGGQGQLAERQGAVRRFFSLSGSPSKTSGFRLARAA